MSGILLVNKPIGITSYKVVSAIKHIYHTSKVGHCGTLDPFADGLLIVTLDKATKLSRFFEDQEKTYKATLVLGVKTDSGDIEGNEIEIMEVPNLTKEQIIDALNSFIGDTYQVPPMYSAIKINGQPLYKKARKGESVDRPDRLIHISKIELLSFVDNIIEFRVSCSKGTYVRTLGEDIANKLNTCGHLKNLTREAIGIFKLENAKDLDKITEQTSLLSIEESLSFLPKITLDEVNSRLVSYGNPIKLECNSDLVVLFSSENVALAIYCKDGDMYRSVRGI